MPLASAYLTRTKNLEAMLQSIRNAQAPEKFNSKFLEALGFTNTNDLLLVGVFRSLGFIDESGAPTDKYFAYLDQNESAKVLAQGIRDAYGDLFRLNNTAHEMSQTALKEKLKTLTRGAKSDSVLTKMAMTFVALCQQADFSSQSVTMKKPDEVTPESPPTAPIPEREHPDTKASRELQLAYSIHIELPPTRDQAVYDAIFRSLKEHIL